VAVGPWHEGIERRALVVVDEINRLAILIIEAIDRCQQHIAIAFIDQGLANDMDGGRELLKIRTLD